MKRTLLTFIFITSFFFGVYGGRAYCQTVMSYDRNKTEDNKINYEFYEPIVFNQCYAEVKKLTPKYYPFCNGDQASNILIICYNSGNNNYCYANLIPTYYQKCLSMVEWQRIADDFCCRGACRSTKDNIMKHPIQLPIRPTPIIP